MTDPEPTTQQAEYEAALRRAFVDRGYESISVYSRRDEFQLNSMAWGCEMGYLKREFVEADEQSAFYRAVLTDAGKKHFGIEG